MIGISVLRVNPYLSSYPAVQRTLAILHAAGIPLLAAIMAFHVHRASLGLV